VGVFFKNCILLGFLFSVAASEASADIDFRTDEFGRILVPVELGDDQNHMFMLDTAARRFGVTAVLVGQGGVKLFKGSHIRHVSSSGTLQLPLAKVSRMSFGKNTRTELLAGLFSSSYIAEGLLGFDAYHGYLLHVMPVDRRMVLHANSGEIARAGWRLIEGSPNSSGGLLVNAEIRDTKVRVLLASGLSRSILSISAARVIFPERFKKGVLIQEKGEREINVAMGFTARKYLLKTLVLKGFKIQDWDLGDLVVGVKALPTGNGENTHAIPFMMLGADVLATHEYVLDTRGHQLWVPPKN